MLFGAGVPELFPIAAISYTILYFLEIFMLHYEYREPP